jgi:hypothetical protein
MTLYRTRLTDFHYMGGRRHSLVYERQILWYTYKFQKQVLLPYFASREAAEDNFNKAIEEGKVR